MKVNIAIDMNDDCDDGNDEWESYIATKVTTVKYTNDDHLSLEIASL